jgi:hypothetical protein
MGVEIVLATLEEYFSLKRDIGEGDGDGTDLDSTRDRAVRALNAYIDLRFNTMMLEEKRKVSTITKRMKAVDPNTKVSWDGVSAAVDALNAPPQPSQHPHPGDKFQDAYKKWYNGTRKKALMNILPETQEESLELSLAEEDFSDLGK